MSTAILQSKELSIGYAGSRGRRVSEGVNIEMTQGEVVSVVGPNGSGKSTLLKTLCGILPPLSGEVLLKNGRLHQFDPRSRAREVAVVLAGRVETGHLSVEKLVSLGRYAYTGRFGTLGKRDRETISWALASVGGEELRDRYVDELSDGEYQRIMIARALAQQPGIVFLDEPAAFLDIMKRVEIMHLLRKISRESSASFIVASHDLEMVMSVSDRIWLMDGGGELHDGAPEDHVLEGTLKRVFRSSHVSFDSYSGSFRHISENHRPVVHFAVAEEHFDGKASAHSVPVSGQRELAGRWTQRALERMGFTVLPAGEGLRETRQRPPRETHREPERDNKNRQNKNRQLRVLLKIIHLDGPESPNRTMLRWRVESRDGEKREHTSIASMARDIRLLYHYMA